MELHECSGFSSSGSVDDDEGDGKGGRREHANMTRPIPFSPPSLPSFSLRQTRLAANRATDWTPL